LKPFAGFAVIQVDALPVLVKVAQLIHGVCVARVGTLLKPLASLGALLGPLGCTDEIFVNALTVQLQHS
jgi:hypothetical protein